LKNSYFTVNALQDYITRKSLKNNYLLFGGLAKSYGESYRRFRNRLAKKLNEPSIATIRLYDLRHAWITKTLMRINNVEIVRQLVGHKRLNTTQKYIHLLATDSQEFDVQGAETKEQAFKLLSAGYTYTDTARRDIRL
jgi:site-specific recombinase XerD